jgi:hypothetical protein
LVRAMAVAATSVSRNGQERIPARQIESHTPRALRPGACAFPVGLDPFTRCVAA